MTHLSAVQQHVLKIISAPDYTAARAVDHLSDLWKQHVRLPVFMAEQNAEAKHVGLVQMTYVCAVFSLAR